MSSHDKERPRDLEAERAVLGAIFIENTALLRVVGILRSADFYMERHRKIFALMVMLSESSQPIDMVLLADLARQEGVFEEVGGLSYLSSLVTAVPLTTHIGHYAGIVRERAVLRRLMDACLRTSEAIQDGENLSAVLPHLEAAREEALGHVGGQGLRPVAEDLAEAFQAIERMQVTKGGITGLPTGLPQLDRLLGGLQPSQLYVLGARPSMGKSALGMNIAAHVARQGLGVAVFSLEMSRLNLTLRLVSAEGRVDISQAREKALGEQSWDSIVKVMDDLNRMPLFIDDSPGTTCLDVRARSRRMVEHGLALVVVDYLTLLRPDRPGDSREQEVAAMSRALKNLARELKVPVLALAQLNRGLESRMDKRPMLSDLRESGAIEQDADVIMFLHRQAKYLPDASEAAKREAELIVAKQRNGPTDTVKLVWMGEHTRFESPTPGWRNG